MVGTIAVKLLCGKSGSGKSTWAAKDAAFKELEGFTTAIISRDAIRFSFLSDEEDYFSHETETWEEFVRQINEAIELGVNFVYVDQTSFNAAARKKILSAINPNTFTRLDIEYFNTSTETCVIRNRERTGRAYVPEASLRNMATQFVPPAMSEFVGDTYGFYRIEINIHWEESM